MCEELLEWLKREPTADEDAELGRIRKEREALLEKLKAERFRRGEKLVESLKAGGLEK